MPRPVATVSAAAVLVFAALTLAHPSSSRILTWPFAALAITTWFLLVATFAAGSALDRGWRFPPRLVALGAGLLLIAAATSALASPFASATLPLTWPTAGGVACLFLLHHWWSASPSARAIAWIPPIGAGFALAAYAIWALDMGRLLPTHTRNTAPFGHSTYTAGACVLVLPWLIYATLLARAALRVCWILATTLALLVLATTQSRGGVLAVCVLTAFALAGLLAFSAWSRPRKLAVALLALGAIGLAIATNSRLRALVVEQRWSDSASESNTQRRAMLQAAFALGRERPVLGWGPGSIPLVYPQVRARLDGGVENVLQVHNTPLQLWATGGALALIAATVLTLGVASAAWHARRDPPALAASASLAGLGLFSLTDHALDLPFFALFCAANVAVITRTLSEPTAPRRAIGRWSIPLAALAIVAGALPATVRDLRARFHYDRALSALETHHPADFLAALERATQAAPHDPFFLHHAAAHLADARASAPNVARQTDLARAAIAHLERSLATGAHMEFAHFNLGWLQLEVGDPASAEKHFAAAAHLVPDKGGVYFGFGLACLGQRKTDAAIRAFALEFINDPRSATSPTWEISPLAQLRPAIEAEMRRLFATLRTQHPPATVFEMWTRWLQADPTVTPADLRAHNAESAAFLAALPHILALQPLPPLTPAFASTRLYATWLASRGPAAPDFRAVMPAASPDYPALIARAQHYPDNFRAFLLAPPGKEQTFSVSYRRQRTGYGVLARHPEGPPLTDVFVVQENQAVTRFASGLFPRKGSIPGRFLLALLPEAPR